MDAGFQTTLLETYKALSVGIQTMSLETYEALGIGIHVVSHSKPRMQVFRLRYLKRTKP